ncbi:MAG: hypothetical protein Q9169_002883 [Polycauliona sp. 2 TL-2023]
MDRAITQALNSLVPEWNNTLPPELIQLAASLLAQSRNKVSSLRAEEEIARTYACAHLACDRLKQSIGLPKIHHRPPCPPKVYEKLYRQFDSALITGARRSSRAVKSLQPDKPTSTSSATNRNSAKTPASAPYSVGRKRKRELIILEQEPTWAMKAIRGLCKQVNAPAATPHIFAGVSSILTIPAPNQESMTEKDLETLRSWDIESLIVAVYLLVRTRLSGVHTSSSTFLEWRDTALRVLNQLQNGGETSAAISPASVIDWMQEIKRGRWTELDWFANVGEGAGLGLDDAGISDVNDTDNSESDMDESVHGGRHEAWDRPEKPYLQPGLNTMMQDRVDLLSDEKRADYQIWKKDILARIDRMEKAERVQESLSFTVLTMSSSNALPPRTPFKSSTSTSASAPTPSFFHQRDALVGEISMAMEQVLQNINKLNRNLEGVIAVGNEFGAVEALWSQFENVMVKESGEGEEVKAESQRGGGQTMDEDVAQGGGDRRDG